MLLKTPCCPVLPPLLKRRTGRKLPLIAILKYRLSLDAVRGQRRSARSRPTTFCAIASSLDLARLKPQKGENTKQHEKIINKGMKSVSILCTWASIAFALVSLFNGISTTPLASVATSAASQGKNMMSAWTGLSAGFLHTLAGPDHLAGLTPLTLGQNQTTAVSMGALWGFGHSSGQLLLGLVFLILKERFNGIVPMLSKWSGTVVGITLTTIGLLGIYESVFHNDQAAEASSHHTIQAKGGGLAKRRLGTYAMGFMYGLHPDALFVVLPALALPTALATLSYVAMFVVGTVCAMAGYTLVIGTASEVASQKRPWLLRRLSTIAASAALAVGLFILIPSLFTNLPS